MRRFSIIFAEILVFSLFFLPNRSSQEGGSASSGAGGERAGKGRDQGGMAREEGLENDEKGAEIRVLLGEEVVEMELEDYVKGVVRAEMPAGWEQEALKAQAVAARSYALYQKSAGKHEDADVCGDSTCCQAYADEEEMKEFWGAGAAEYEAKISAAAEETAGEALWYNGNRAATVYHASSVGRTREAAEVWGQAVDYLIEVETTSEQEAKGHGVGMSQWGAKGMAENGKTYSEILAHYYPGTELKKE